MPGIAHPGVIHYFEFVSLAYYFFRFSVFPFFLFAPKYVIYAHPFVLLYEAYKYHHTFVIVTP
jgi:hypothetical protein